MNNFKELLSGTFCTAVTRTPSRSCGRWAAVAIETQAIHHGPAIAGNHRDMCIGQAVMDHHMVEQIGKCLHRRFAHHARLARFAASRQCQEFRVRGGG